MKNWRMTNSKKVIELHHRIVCDPSGIMIRHKLFENSESSMKSHLESHNIYNDVIFMAIDTQAISIVVFIKLQNFSPLKFFAYTVYNNITQLIKCVLYQDQVKMILLLTALIISPYHEKPTHRDLGIIYPVTLQWRLHYGNITPKAYKILGLKHLLKLKNYSIMITCLLYCSPINSRYLIFIAG